MIFLRLLVSPDQFLPLLRLPGLCVDLRPAHCANDMSFAESKESVSEKRDDPVERNDDPDDNMDDPDDAKDLIRGTEASLESEH